MRNRGVWGERNFRHSHWGRGGEKGRKGRRVTGFLCWGEISSSSSCLRRRRKRRRRRRWKRYGETRTKAHSDFAPCQKEQKLLKIEPNCGMKRRFKEGRATRTPRRPLQYRDRRPPSSRARPRTEEEKRETETEETGELTRSRTRDCLPPPLLLLLLHCSFK